MRRLYETLKNGDPGFLRFLGGLWVGGAFGYLSPLLLSRIG
jgi:hypothetical protein